MRSTLVRLTRSKVLSPCCARALPANKAAGPANATAAAMRREIRFVIPFPPCHIPR